MKGKSEANVITAFLANGESLHEAAQQARQYINRAIESAPGLGIGQEPINSN